MQHKLLRRPVGSCGPSPRDIATRGDDFLTPGANQLIELNIGDRTDQR
jgi:hypothetical protein